MHLTETCEPDSPNLITQVYTTAATVPDIKATAPIEQSLAANGYEGEHFKLDWEGQKAECPQGETDRKWQTKKDREAGPDIF